MIIVSRLIILLFPVFAYTQVISEGLTYPIAEPNMLTEIQQKSKNINWGAIQREYKLSNTINRLPIAKEDYSFTFEPVTELPFEVKDKDGKIIYPKGFSFNPLKYTSLPYQLVVVGSIKQFEQIKNKINLTDIILVANIDPKYFIEKTGYRAFILTKDAINRLGVKRVPSIIKQTDIKFTIQEYKIEVQ